MMLSQAEDSLTELRIRLKCLNDKYDWLHNLMQKSSDIISPPTVTKRKKEYLFNTDSFYEDSEIGSFGLSDYSSQINDENLDNSKSLELYNHSNQEKSLVDLFTKLAVVKVDSDDDIMISDSNSDASTYSTDDDCHNDSFIEDNDSFIEDDDSFIDDDDSFDDCATDDGNDDEAYPDKNCGNLKLKYADRITKSNCVTLAKQVYLDLNRFGFNNQLPTDLEINWNNRLLTTAGLHFT